MGGFGAAYAAFLTATVVLVSLVFGAAFAVAGAEQRTVDRITAKTATIKRWGGWTMAAVGVWLLSLAIFADFFSRIFPV
jgi:hypothetical protein